VVTVRRGPGAFSDQVEATCYPGHRERGEAISISGDMEIASSLRSSQ
jgi:hypothetical protein